MTERFLSHRPKFNVMEIAYIGSYKITDFKPLAKDCEHVNETETKDRQIHCV